MTTGTSGLDYCALARPLLADPADTTLTKRQIAQANALYRKHCR